MYERARPRIRRDLETSNGRRAVFCGSLWGGGGPGFFGFLPLERGISTRYRTAFRFFRQPSRVSTTSPVAKRERVWGIGTT